MGEGCLAGYARLATKGGEMADGPLVAVVDDDKSIRDATSDLLKSSGYVPAVFEDAESFLSWPGRGAAACLIADMHMPGMSGLQLCEALAASSQPIPTVIITAHPDETTKRRARKAGITGYLTKPFGPEELLEHVSEALAGFNGRQPKA